MSVLFLFGAGASYGSGPCTPTTPPLGKDLIIRMREKGGIAATIEGDLLDLFIADPELGMSKFFEDRNGETTELLKQMCGYLAQFRIDNGNYYTKLFSILKKRKHICIATTNYDLLIEQAICSLGYLVQYFSDERHHNNIPVLKIHGSINFIPDANIRNMQIIVPPTHTAGIFEGDVKAFANTNDIIEYCESDTALSPAVAIYHPQKIVLHCPSFVKFQQDNFHQEVKRSSKIFIIGLKVNPNDKHIWETLEKTKADIYIVDIDRPLVSSWINSITKKNVYHIADTFEESIERIKKILRV
ncbi:TPA: hypothetical protein I8542_003112 [Raoultella ornithinolytica]|nr:hypothetical protein [Raoultella ornithinolytica]